MFPSKGIEYSEDIQKLFPKPRTMDADHTYLGQSSFQTPIANRSTSSADSISPESYFEPTTTTDYFNLRTRPQTPKYFYETPKPSYESPPLISQRYGSISSVYEPTFDQVLESSLMYESFQETPTNSRHIFETPMATRRQPLIIGRKILGRNHSKPEQKIIEQEYEWHGLPQSPDTQKTYELFPPEKGFQFSTPTKTERRQSNAAISPIYAPIATNLSSNIQRNFTTPYKPGNNAPKDVGQSKMCTFCRKNGETPVVYMTHCVKEKQGNRFIVTCPILRSHVCPICNLSGDEAHTITYCPILRNTNDGKPLTSTTITLKNTRIKSNGRRRY